MSRWTLALLGAIAVDPGALQAQFDPDWRVAAADTYQHAGGGALVDTGLRLICDKPWERLTGTAVVGLAWELAQWDAAGRPRRCQAGYCIGLKDLAFDLAGAAAAELMVAGVKKLLR